MAKKKTTTVKKKVAKVVEPVKEEEEVVVKESKPTLSDQEVAIIKTKYDGNVELGTKRLKNIRMSVSTDEEYVAKLLVVYGVQ